jgi:hypothetical protein
MQALCSQDAKVVLSELTSLKRLSDEAAEAYERIKEGKLNFAKAKIVGTSGFGNGLVQAFADIWGKHFYYYRRQRPYRPRGLSRDQLCSLLDDMKVLYIPIRPGLLRHMGFSHSTIKSVTTGRRDIHPTKARLKGLTYAQQEVLFR